MPRPPAHDFAAWQKRFPYDPSMSESLRDDALSDALFLHWSVTAPLPWAGHFGSWDWHRDARTLAGFVRHVRLPEMLADWFGRRTWDATFEDARLPVEDLLAGAEAHDFLADDVPLVRQLLAPLDAALADPAADVLPALRAFLAAFTARFGRTPTFDLRLDLHEGLMAAAEPFYEGGGGLGGEPTDTLDEWLALCARAPEDDDAAEAVGTAFAEGDEV